MRLLVSVSDVAEAEAALAGGADIIDAKDPLRGALGRVELEAMRRIAAACAGCAPVTAALGEAAGLDDIESLAAAFASAGALFVKVGLAGVQSRAQMLAALRSAVRGASISDASEKGVMAVAYADAERASSPSPDEVMSAAVECGAAGVLLDTADKHGPGLRGLMSFDAVRQWVVAGHERGLLIAVAGKLSAEDIDWLTPLGIDIVGVRGAACEAGRESRISTARVSMLRARCATPLPLGR